MRDAATFPMSQDDYADRGRLVTTGGPHHGPPIAGVSSLGTAFGICTHGEMTSRCRRCTPPADVELEQPTDEAPLRLLGLTRRDLATAVELALDGQDPTRSSAALCTFLDRLHAVLTYGGTVIREQLPPRPTFYTATVRITPPAGTAAVPMSTTEKRAYFEQLTKRYGALGPIIVGQPLDLLDLPASRDTDSREQLTAEYGDLMLREADRDSRAPARPAKDAKTPGGYRSIYRTVAAWCRLRRHPQAT